MMDRAEAFPQTESGPQAESGPEPAGSVAPQQEELRERIIDAIRTVYDPEIPVNLYELGLIYRLDIDDNGAVDIDMTLTAPGCPVAGEMPLQVQDVVEAVEGVREAKVTLTFEPPWEPSRMSDDARMALDMF